MKKMFNVAANPQVQLEELRERLVTLNQQAKTIQATADEQKRELTEEEETQINQIFAAFESTKADVARREKMLANEAELGEPNERRAVPTSVAAAQAAAAAPAKELPRHAVTSGGERVGASAKGTYGFTSFGEFANAVRRSVRGQMDNRLVANSAPTRGAESPDADGGYAIPPDFRQDIVVQVFGEDQLLARTDQQRTSSNQITVPLDSTTPWQTVGGIQATWEGEAVQHTPSKPALGQLVVRANKLVSLVPVTDELLEDVPALGSYLRRKTPEKMNYKINDALINGDGNGCPEGLLNAASAVEVAKGGTQANGSVIYENIVAMWARLYAPFRNGAVWLINQDVEPELMKMVVPATDGVAVPAYLPPGGLSASPYGTLMGRPCIPTEACAQVGYPGDIILTNLSQYMSVVKSSGLRQETSIHLWFDYDITAFKFTVRVGGKSWLPAAITRANGSNTLSNIVTLAARHA